MSGRAPGSINCWLECQDLRLRPLSPKRSVPCEAVGSRKQGAQEKFRLLTETPYALFPTLTSTCLHLGHSKECNSKPGRSGSIPKSRMFVPHLGQAGRLIESECGEAGW